jgi:ElaB/YqjD/DUF883 family membrane-anchored ribosome-binding protein
MPAAINPVVAALRAATNPEFSFNLRGRVASSAAATRDADDHARNRRWKAVGVAAVLVFLVGVSAARIRRASLRQRAGLLDAVE